MVLIVSPGANASAPEASTDSAPPPPALPTTAQSTATGSELNVLNRTVKAPG